MNLKSLTEGMRALVYKSYFMEDISRHAPDGEERNRARGLLELLTPLVKAYCSDRIFEMGREGIQILGGYGFTKEYPVEQYTRDCKILSIWDGTNYIQSMDLIGRKLAMEKGKIFRNWLDGVSGFVHESRKTDLFTLELDLLEEALEKVVEMSLGFMRWMKEGKLDLIPLAGTRFLDCMSEVVISQLLLEQGCIAHEQLGDGSLSEPDRCFYRGKVATVRYYCRNFLPQVFGRARMIGLEDMTAVAMDEACLG